MTKNLLADVQDKIYFKISECVELLDLDGFVRLSMLIFGGMSARKQPLHAQTPPKSTAWEVSTLITDCI